MEHSFRKQFRGQAVHGDHRIVPKPVSEALELHFPSNVEIFDVDFKNAPSSGPVTRQGNNHTFVQRCL